MRASALEHAHAPAVAASVEPTRSDESFANVLAQAREEESPAPEVAVDVSEATPSEPELGETIDVATIEGTEVLLQVSIDAPPAIEVALVDVPLEIEPSELAVDPGPESQTAVAMVPHDLAPIVIAAPVTAAPVDVAVADTPLRSSAIRRPVGPPNPATHSRVHPAIRLPATAAAPALASAGPERGTPQSIVDDTVVTQPVLAERPLSRVPLKHETRKHETRLHTSRSRATERDIPTPALPDSLAQTVLAPTPSAPPQSIARAHADPIANDREAKDSALAPTPTIDPIIDAAAPRTPAPVGTHTAEELHPQPLDPLASTTTAASPTLADPIPTPTAAPSPLAKDTHASSSAPAMPTSEAPVVLARAEDLATAIERLRPIPRGGATIDLETPGMGALRLQVRVEDGVVKVRIHASSPEAATWLAQERDGLTAAARGAVAGALDIELDLRGGSSGGSNDGERRPGREPMQSPTSTEVASHAHASTRTTAPATPPTPARGLVDVLA